MDPYPIDSVLPELTKALLGWPSVVLQAPPGSGKTTRVPLALLDILPGSQRIVMLEPRRIAAVAAARWMARLLGEPVGKTVGYTIRFERKTSEETRIEVVTEGILTRRLIDDPVLEDVAVIILDEFHERGLQADLALALSLDIQRNLRPDLKLLVMSATIETAPVAALLGGAPVITAIGGTHPVEEHFLADERRSGGRGGGRPDLIVGAIRTALQDTMGDILVFLPRAGEIRQAAAALAEVVEGRKETVSLHPLYGDLPFAEQERAIMPGTGRKIVLATNIAETSLTIEGVRVVIDAGLVRRLRYDPETGMNRLVTATTSKASAIQRRGRAGRLGPGVCYRLYSRHVYDSMVPFDPPEILISDLASLALDLAAWGVTDPSALSWLDPPPGPAWEAARRLLTDLDALDGSGVVTALGRAMARFPIHPRLGRLLLRAAHSGKVGLGADLAALLSERDIMRRDPRRKEADMTERTSVLRRWRKDEKAPQGTDPWALKAVERAARQLRHLAGKGPGRTDRGDEDEVIPSLLLHAYPDRIAQRRPEGEGRYLLSQGRGVRLPRESLLGTHPFLVAVHLDSGERAEGTIHMAEPVTEERIRHEMGGHIRTIRQVEWSRQEGRVMAVLTERLGALTLSATPLPASDEEVVPVLCDAIRSGAAPLAFGREVRQLQGRIALVRRVSPDAGLPDCSDEALMAALEIWLSPWLPGVRTAEQLGRVPLSGALRALLSRAQINRLDRDAPAAMTVPSGRTIPLDYTAGDAPVLAVKLQEMFGLAVTPAVAGGRVPVLLHLLSPAGRPVQITRDLKGFWETGYPLVKKELQGRYPKHPWPEDPWNAPPTHRTSRRK